ncbi:MAG: RNA polymerase sigma factor [Halofilum sp. (in: g-proteobacteria)]
MTAWLNKLRGTTEFERAIAPHVDALSRMAVRLTGNQPDAEDLLQDVLTQLYARRRTLGKVDNLRPWLLGVLYRRYGERWRHDAPDPRHPAIGDDVDAIGTDIETPDAVFERGLTAERLQQALDRLPPEHRHVLLMHDVEGYSLPEIATAMEVPEGTLKSRLHRARGGMRREIVELDGGMWPRAS